MKVFLKKAVVVVAIGMMAMHSLVLVMTTWMVTLLLTLM